VAVIEEPIVTVTVQEPVVPLTNVPDVAPPVADVAEHPEMEKGEPDEMKAGALVGDVEPPPLDPPLDPPLII